VEGALRGRVVAASLALVAAFLWATYYLFVLEVSPATRPSAILVYPFVAGGAALVVWALAHRNGRALGRTFVQPASYLRLALLLAMQLGVIAATFLIGPVDASLLSLLGDVVATPLIVAALFALGREELGVPLVVAGLLLSLAGGTLAIVGGHGIAAIHGVGWLVVVSLPIVVALYFVLCARAGASTPVPVVVAQATVGAAVASVALAPLVPGGVAGLFAVSPWDLTLLLVNGLLSFFVGPLLYFRAIARAGFVLPPMMMTGIPVFTLLLSAAVLAIAPTPLAVLGVPIAAVGGVVALTAGGRRAERG